MSPLTPTSSLRRTNILHNQILRAAGLRKNMQDSTYKQPISFTVLGKIST